MSTSLTNGYYVPTVDCAQVCSLHLQMALAGVGRLQGKIRAITTVLQLPHEQRLRKPPPLLVKPMAKEQKAVEKVSRPQFCTPQ